MNVYDDPYLRLALFIISHYPEHQIKRAIEDDEWLKARIREDCVDLDLAGPFVDAIVQDLDTHKRLWLRARLKELGDAFYTQLDVKRLRKKIIQLIVLS